jgi:hypothetical protein
MIHQLVLHTEQIIKATSTRDLDPLPLANNELNWKPIGPSQWCVCNVFHYDSVGDYLQTCQVNLTKLRSTRLPRLRVKIGVT